jgi:DnaB-like helicase C terminal domain
MIDFGLGAFGSVGDRLTGERKERLERGQAVLGFGVTFLDRALGGIFANDLVLLGAKTGIGKTALSTNVALSNARKGKRVHYFALEAEPREIERRIKYQLLVAMAVQYLDSQDRERLNYLDWYRGALDDILGRHEEAVDKVLSAELGTLRTYYKAGDFTGDDITRLFLGIQDETDLIVLDHLHYVDSDDPNENRGYKAIVKKIRDAALTMAKPVLVVAHIRKSDRRTKQLLPSVEDFHGSSDVPKIATKAIMLAPAFDVEAATTYLWPTYFQVVKCRADGARTRFAACVAFNARLSAYEREFTLGKLTNNGEEFEPLNEGQWPRWARA